jgi:hypothetical protein
MGSAKNSPAAGPLGGPPATEYKLPIFDCRLPIGTSRTSSFEFPVSNFEFPRSGKMDGRKKIYERSHQVIENKGSQNKLTEKKRTFWFKYRTFWFNVVTFWRGHAAFFGHFGKTC